MFSVLIFFSRQFTYLPTPSFKLVLTTFHNKLLKEKLWSRMEWNCKTKQNNPPNKTQITAALKKPTLSPVIFKQNTLGGSCHVRLQSDGFHDKRSSNHFHSVLQHRSWDLKGTVGMKGAWHHGWYSSLGKSGRHGIIKTLSNERFYDVHAKGEIT